MENPREAIILMPTNETATLLSQVEGLDAQTAQLILRFDNLLGNEVLVELFFGVRTLLRTRSNPTQFAEGALKEIEHLLDSYDRFHYKILPSGTARELIDEDMVPPGFPKVDLLRMTRGEYRQHLLDVYKNQLEPDRYQRLEKQFAEELISIKNAGKLSSEEFADLLGVLGIKEIKNERAVFIDAVLKDEAAEQHFSNYFKNIGSRIGNAWKEFVLMNPMLDPELAEQLRAMGRQPTQITAEVRAAFVKKMEPRALLELFCGGSLTPELAHDSMAAFFDKIRDRVPDEQLSLTQKKLYNMLGKTPLPLEEIYLDLNDLLVTAERAT